MPKAIVTFTNPEQPKFLTEIKQKLGIKVPDTIASKKVGLDDQNCCHTSNEFDDLQFNDELPVIVLNHNESIAPEQTADFLKNQIQEDKKAADLTKPIIFKNPVKRSNSTNDSKQPSKRKKAQKSVLSFEDDDF